MIYRDPALRLGQRIKELGAKRFDRLPPRISLKILAHSGSRFRLSLIGWSSKGWDGVDVQQRLVQGIYQICV